MVNALQDRPASTPPPPAGQVRHPRAKTALRLSAAALVAVVAVVGADRAVGLLPSWDNPLQEAVIDHQRPALVLALADLSEYHAAQGTYQVVVDLERDTPYVPGLVKGERTTYLAVGAVDGLVDFRGLSGAAVRTEGESVTITLPPATLGEADLDLEQSRVLARDRGLVDRISGAFGDSPTSERDVALLAERKLEDAAASSDLLSQAEESTRRTLTSLARSFGYSDVTVRFDGDAGT